MQRITTHLHAQRQFHKPLMTTSHIIIYVKYSKTAKCHHLNTVQLLDFSIAGPLGPKALPKFTSKLPHLLFYRTIRSDYFGNILIAHCMPQTF